MTLDEFKSSLARETPPTGVSKHLEALWHAGKGEWDTAHRLIQDLSGPEAAWIHAYLHREEGDISNAGYWYRRANKPLPEASLEEEWTQIAAALLELP